MAIRRTLWFRLLFVVLVLLSVESSLAQQSQILGYEAWYSNYSGCQCNPDGWDMYIVYGYQVPEGHWVVTSRIHIGYTTHYCTWGELTGTFSYHSEWQKCTAAYPEGCPCAATQMGQPPCNARGTYMCSGWG